MKILMISMFSSHFFNWTKQLENAGHEIFWIDVYDANQYVEKIDFVHQIVGWRNKIKYPGRYKVKQKFPGLYNFINKFNQRKLEDILEKKLKTIQPDIVQSFEMFSSSIPVLGLMKKNPQIPWIYSIWGNDLYYFQKEETEEVLIRKVLDRVDYLFADCQRDFMLAKNLGYKNKFLGVYPTGGGYDFSNYDPYIKKSAERDIILIKGYQHTFGRCNVILEAISKLKSSLADMKIVVFGANKEVLHFAKKNKLHEWKNFKVYEQVSHERVLELMGRARIYIGNSVSDGMPNTLLEAIIMGAFPIQSNPGGVTEEIIIDGTNGYLIEDPENADEIASHLGAALSNPKLIKNSMDYNFQFVKPKFGRKEVMVKVVQQYKLLEEQLT